MTTTGASIPTRAATYRIQSWLRDNWDPDLTVGGWWERLGLAGWAAPSLPEHAYGLGLAPDEADGIQRAIVGFGALPGPNGIGLLLAAPTVAAHGTQLQIDRWIPDIVTGRSAWCQLFSEPGAGSDLAGVNCRAQARRGGWVINGQKVWNSGADTADYGLLLARTDPTRPKHAGLSYFALDMRQPGVEVRPLREMTGRSMFFEVFLTDVWVPKSDIIGGLNEGWSVANTTLGVERVATGAGGGTSIGYARPGAAAGELDRRAGDVAGWARTGGANMPQLLSSPETVVRLARATGATADPGIRQELASLHILSEVARFHQLRQAATADLGGILGFAHSAKLATSEIARRIRDLGFRLLGPNGFLNDYAGPDSDLDALTGIPGSAGFAELALFSVATSIYGGTDQIQRTVLAERSLGLPREPGPPRDMPFQQLPRNG